MKDAPAILQLTASEVGDLLKLWKASKQAVRDTAEEPPFILRLAHSCSEAALLDQMARPGAYTDLNWALACNPSLSPSVRRQLLGANTPLRADWAGSWNPGNAEHAEDTALFRMLAVDPETSVRCSLAENKKMPAELLHAMISDSDPQVLVCVARNPNLSGGDALQLAHNPHVQVREAILESVSAENVLLVLTHDVDQRIRQAALERLPVEDEEEPLAP